MKTFNLMVLEETTFRVRGRTFLENFIGFILSSSPHQRLISNLFAFITPEKIGFMEAFVNVTEF